MEDEKNKKKHKKKKNKQGKQTTLSAEETAALEQNHCIQDAAVSEPDAKSDQIDEERGVTCKQTTLSAEETAALEQNHCIQDAAVSEPDAKSDQIDEARGVTCKQTTLSAEETAALEQNHCIQEAAVSEPDAKSDQIDEARGVTSNVMLDKDVRQLEAEKHSWLQREKKLEEGIKRAVIDKKSWSLKEARLVEKIKHLQNDKDSFIQKEANMEKKIKHLQSEKGLWVQLQESLFEQIKQLQTELGSLILKESSIQETIAKLTAINVGLQIQVKELNESKNDVVQQNQQLVESISLLKSRIQHLERECPDSSGVVKKESSEDEDPGIVIESARALVEKLVIENAELVEKLNEFYVELERRRGPAADSSVVKFNPIMVNEGTHTNRLQDSLLEKSGKNESVPTMQTLHEITVEPDVPSTAEAGAQLEELSLESHQNGRIGEIVSVPLQEGEIQEIEEVNLNITEIDDPSAVPFSDAPLVGAPFRLISFVAKFVSGADLVENGSHS